MYFLLFVLVYMPLNLVALLQLVLLYLCNIYIIRNNTITIAGANTKRSLLLTMIQLGQLLMLELMVIFGGRILHSFSIFSLILAVIPGAVENLLDDDYENNRGLVYKVE